MQASGDPTVQLIMGPPASGKTTLAKRLCGATPGIVRLSRDDTGGALRELVPRVRKALQGGQSVVLDNLFATAAERRPFIEESRKRDTTITCMVVDLDIEQCMINACRRIIQSSGRLLAPDEIERSRDASVIPPVVLFHYRKRFEPPSEREGFDSIEHVAGHRPEFTGTGKALFVDYDGTLRETINGGKYPVDPSQVRVLPGRTAVLKAYQAMGYRILGVSNQSGIEGGDQLVRTHHHHLGGIAASLAQQATGVAEFVRRVEMKSHLGHVLVSPASTALGGRFGAAIGRLGGGRCLRHEVGQQ